MPKIIEYADYKNSSADVKEAYDKQAAKNGGYVTNMKKTLLNNLPSYKALMEWFTLREEALKFITEKEFAVFCHAVSSENDCLLCSVYFRKELSDLGFDLNNLKFSDRELLLESFGRAIVKDANGVSEDLFARLKRIFSQEQIVVLTAFASQMIATNIINKVLKIELDDNLTAYVKKQ
jgi:alkylhydroperoxidase family enzyme